MKTGAFKKTIYFLLILCAGTLGSLRADNAVFNPKMGIPYKTYIFGLSDYNLRSAVMAQSVLIKKETNPPENINILKNRAEQDLLNIQKILAAFGYYDADLDYFVDTRTKPTIVYMKINLGPQYTVGAFKIKSDPPGNALVMAIAQDIDKVGISLGDTAKRSHLQMATTRTMERMHDHGYPFAVLKEDRIIIDRSQKQMQAALLISPGPLVRFGNTMLQENGGVTGEFIKSRLRWKKGEVYNQKKVTDTLQSLINTSLFKEVKITHDDRVDNKGLVTMYIKLEEGAKNIVRPTAHSIPGLGLEPGISWKRRNLWNLGHMIDVEVKAGQHEQVGEITYTVPDWQKLNLNLVTDGRLENDKFKAYAKKAGTLKSMVHYPLYPNLSVRGGASLEINKLNHNFQKQDYRWLSVPLGLTYNTLSDPETPRSGVIINLELMPYMRVLNRFSFFSQVDLRPEVFVPLSEDKNLVFHGSGHFGFSPGAGKNIIPADKLYYGGGDVMRGYTFQMAGPLMNNIPVGGRSLITMSLDLQYYFREDFSANVFTDFGAPQMKDYPDFKTSFLWAVGAGVKYHSPWGIFYLDVASPLKKRSVDQSIQVLFGLSKKIV
jgi:translocation and assembly module TamA